MSANGLGLAEQIVRLFERRVTEAHRSAICFPLGITDEQFDQVISRARDIGIERDLRLTPIYDRDGWWTSEPTERLAAIALRTAVERNLGEAERNARVYDSFLRVGPSARVHEHSIMGSIAAIEATLPALAIDVKSDYVVERVDHAVSHGKGFVVRAMEAAA